MATASPPPVVTMQLEALQVQSDDPDDEEEDVKEEDDSFLIPENVQQRSPIAQQRQGSLHAGVSPFRPIATASSAGPALPMIPARASLEFTEPATSPGAGASFLEGPAGRPAHSRTRNLSRGEGRLPVFYTLQVNPRRWVKWGGVQEAVFSRGWRQALQCLATIHSDMIAGVSHGARPVHQIITMIQWIRTSRLSIKNSLSFAGGFWIGTRVLAAIGPLLPNQQHRQCVPTLEATQGQILSQSPTDATRFWWHLYGS